MWFQTWVKTRALASDLCVIHLISICEGQICVLFTWSPSVKVCPSLALLHEISGSGSPSAVQEIIAALPSTAVTFLSWVMCGWTEQTDRLWVTADLSIWEYLLWITPHFALNTMFCLRTSHLYLNRLGFSFSFYIYIYLIKPPQKITISCYILLSWYKSCHIVM